MSNGERRSTFTSLKRTAGVCRSVVVLLAPAAARAGFDRCEALRRKHEVEQCVQNERR